MAADSSSESDDDDDYTVTRVNGKVVVSYNRSAAAARPAAPAARHVQTSSVAAAAPKTRYLILLGSESSDHTDIVTFRYTGYGDDDDDDDDDYPSMYSRASLKKPVAPPERSVRLTVLYNPHLNSYDVSVLVLPVVQILPVVRSWCARLQSQHQHQQSQFTRRRHPLRKMRSKGGWTELQVGGAVERKRSIFMKLSQIKTPSELHFGFLRSRQCTSQSIHRTIGQNRKALLRALRGERHHSVQRQRNQQRKQHQLRQTTAEAGLDNSSKHSQNLRASLILCTIS